MCPINPRKHPVSFIDGRCFYIPLYFQQPAARLKRIQTPVCVTSPRGRRMTLTGCCYGRTVPRMPALTSCEVSAPPFHSSADRSEHIRHVAHYKAETH